MTTIDLDGFAILAVLGKAPRDQGTTGPQIQAATGLDPDRINDAVSTLVDWGWAEWSQHFGTQPYDFGEVSITTRGRREHQELQEASEISEQRPFVAVPYNLGAGPAAEIRLFVSHAADDRELASRLVRLVRSALLLPASAIRCTSVDGYGLPGGAHTEDQLRSEVNNAEIFLGILSESSLSSLFVLFELGARWGVQRDMIPLLAHGFASSRLRAPLNGLNALSLEKPAHIHQLIKELASGLGIEPQPAATYLEDLNLLQQPIEVRLTQASGAPVSKEQTPAPTDALLLTEEMERVLMLYTERSPAPSSAAVSLGISVVRTQHFIDELIVRHKMLQRVPGVVGGGALHVITPAGRHYLFRRGLI